MSKPLLTSLLFATTLCLSAAAQAAENYDIDTKGMHAFIEFKIKHLGFSWLLGRFNSFGGSFSYDDKDPSRNTVKVDVDVASVDSNHAERDKHLRSEKFFDVAKFPQASFVSTSYVAQGQGKGVLKGKFTLRGVSKDIAIDVQQVGAGKDPWGGYRRGFEGRTVLHLSDYAMTDAKMLGPDADTVEVHLFVEGLRK
jgi:polyisoprenoid-binding protein YceI